MQSRPSGEAPDSRATGSFTRKEPWTATYFDNLKLFSVQLACAGGSSAIAKTAVAPLERVKVPHSGGAGHDRRCKHASACNVSALDVLFHLTSVPASSAAHTDVCTASLRARAAALEQRR